MKLSVITAKAPEIKEEEPPVVEVEINLEGVFLQLDETCDIVSCMCNDADELVAVLDNLDAAIASLETHGATAPLMDLLNAEGDLVALLGLEEMPEITDETKEELTKASTEALSDNAKKVLDAIIQFFKDMAAKIADFIKRIMSAMADMKKGCQLEIARLKAIKEAKPFSEMTVLFQENKTVAAAVADVDDALDKSSKLFDEVQGLKTAIEVSGVVRKAGEIVNTIRVGTMAEQPIGSLGVKDVGDVIAALEGCVKILDKLAAFKTDVKKTEKTIQEALRLAEKELVDANKTVEEKNETKQSIKLMQGEVKAGMTVLMGSAKVARSLTYRVLTIANKIEAVPAKN